MSDDIAVTFVSTDPDERMQRIAEDTTRFVNWWIAEHREDAAQLAREAAAWQLDAICNGFGVVGPPDDLPDPVGDRPVMHIDVPDAARLAYSDEALFGGWESDIANVQYSGFPTSHLGDAFQRLTEAAFDCDNYPDLEAHVAWVEADRDYCEAVAVATARAVGVACE